MTMMRVRGAAGIEPRSTTICFLVGQVSSGWMRQQGVTPASHEGVGVRIRPSEAEICSNTSQIGWMPSRVGSASTSGPSTHWWRMRPAIASPM